MEIDELVDDEDSAWPTIQEWIRTSSNDVTILPADDETAVEALEAVQITTQSTLGAIVYHTGGLLVDDGWLRVLGSGSERVPRSLPGWNEMLAAEGMTALDGRYLVADDAVGGFFAVNGGWFDSEIGTVHYFAPDTLEWENLQWGYTEFVHWCCTGDVAGFYEGFRWEGWRADVAELDGDEAFTFSPPLYSREAHVERPTRHAVSVLDIWRQFHADDE